MFRFAILTGILAAAMAWSAPAFAADEGAMFAKHWQTSQDFTLAVAAAMPATDYNFKPNDAEMSFGRLMTHIAMVNNRTFATVSGLQAPQAPASIAAAYQDPKGLFDKDATTQFLRDSFDFCTKALAAITPARLDALAPLTGRERLWSCFTHTAHHRGQAEVYLRIKNIKPPDYKF